LVAVDACTEQNKRSRCYGYKRVKLGCKSWGDSDPGPRPIWAQSLDSSSSRYFDSSLRILSISHKKNIPYTHSRGHAFSFTLDEMSLVLRRSRIRRGPHTPQRALLHTLSSIVDNLPPAVAKFHDVVAVKGEGVYVETACGRRLLDLTSGIGVTSTGHSHPIVVEAIKRQVCVGLDRRAVEERTLARPRPPSFALSHSRCALCPFARQSP